MKTLLIILPVFLFVYACGQQDNRTNEQRGHEENQHEHFESGNNKLDNGNKWKANPETNEEIHKMTRIVDDYINEPKGNAGEVISELKSSFRNILDKCTMEGEAHNQLHNYLHPLHEKIKAAEKSQNDEHFAEILEYLETYENYFE